MNENRSMKQRVETFLHDHFLKCLIASYLLAAYLPAPGLWLRDRSLGQIHVDSVAIQFALPALLLGTLLFNAGLGLKIDQLRRIARSPKALVAGLVANTFVPLLFIGFVSYGMTVWHDRSEVQCILLGLALVAAMPVAGSSTAWTQNTNGDLALGLGLVLGSTLLSPLTTPFALELVSRVTEGEYKTLLTGLGDSHTGFFLVIFVLVPTILGLSTRSIIGSARLKPLMPEVKIVNTIILLVLCYSNAAVSLPQVLADPDWDFLGAALTIVTGMCVVGFTSGAVVGRLCRTGTEQRTALMFGLGMNNNGTAMVLASVTLAAYPRVMLPVILFNLVQHVVAGVIARNDPGIRSEPPGTDSRPTTRIASSVQPPHGQPEPVRG